jgi:ferrochelatase
MPGETLKKASSEKVGVLVINLGTPDSTEVEDVRRYLRQFLSDPRVLDINPLLRWFLLNFIILRRRPAESAHAYKSIWMEEGSPLLVYSHALVEELRLRMPDRVIALGMRYGNPSIESALDELARAQVDRVIVAPLYPQYAASSTGTALEVVYEHVAKGWNVPSVQVLSPFYEHEGFIDAWASVCRRAFDDFNPDHVLLSYHGLPERHVQKSDPTGQHCLQEGCCDAIVDANRHCYKAHCYATTRALCASLGLEGDFSVAFQSRLLKDPWVQPFTDERLVELAKSGSKRLAVVCPSFVADCLETLEEIGIRAKEDFQAAGGEDLRLVPSLNVEEVWVAHLTRMLEEL